MRYLFRCITFTGWILYVKNATKRVWAHFYKILENILNHNIINLLYLNIYDLSEIKHNN